MANLATHAMLVDANMMRPKYVSRFFLIRSLWKMDVVGVGERASQTTNLWREGFSCQFAPTERAVLDMLSFLGFNHSEVLQPTEKGLEPRYHKRERGTFLAVR